MGINGASLQKHVPIDLDYSFARIFKEFVSKGLLGLRIKPTQEKENQERIFFFFNGNAWSGVKRLQAFEKISLVGGPGDLKMECKTARNLSKNGLGPLLCT